MVGAKPGDSNEDASWAEVTGNGNGCGAAFGYGLNLPLSYLYIYIYICGVVCSTRAGLPSGAFPIALHDCGSMIAFQIVEGSASSGSKLGGNEIFAVSTRKIWLDLLPAESQYRINYCQAVLTFY